MVSESTIDHFYRELSGTIGVFQGIRFFIAPTIDEVCYYALEYDVGRHDFAKQLMEKHFPDMNKSYTPAFGLLRQQEELPALHGEDRDSIELEQCIQRARHKLAQAQAVVQQLEKSWWNRTFKEDEIRKRKHDRWNCKGEVVQLEGRKEFQEYQRKAVQQYLSRFSSEPADALIHFGDNLNGPMPGEQRSPSCFFYLVGKRPVVNEFVDIALRHHQEVPDIIKGLVARTPYAARAHTYDQNCLHYDISDPDNKFLRSKDLKEDKKDSTFYKYPFQIFLFKDLVTGTVKTF